ncbi:MAG: hypothetical protein COV73_00265, partial [Candidatus Omnitrophica bacterium CG11_big_fil_rev_8_21_14_0_20_43_6]
MVESRDSQVARKLEEIRDSVAIRAGPFTYIYGAFRNNTLYLDSFLLDSSSHIELLLTLLHEAGAALGRDDAINEELAIRYVSNAYLPIVRSLEEARELLESLKYIEQLDEPVELVIVVPMCNEKRRLLPKSAENPFGEDALRKKVEQFQTMHRVGLRNIEGEEVP